MRKLVFLILSFAPFFFIRAQRPDEKNFTLYTTKDGLSSNDVGSVVQDAYGYIWIGTLKGLNRFDGNSFLQFYSDSGINSLPRDWVYGLKWLNKEELAVTTLSGVHVINSRTLQRHNMFIPPDSLKNRSAVNTAQDVIADADGNIFIITGTGFYEFNNLNKLVFRYDHYNSKYAQTGWVNFGRNIINAGPNTLLLSTIGGLYVYNTDQKHLHVINTKDNPFYQQIAKPKEWFWFMHGDENSFSVQQEGGINLFYYDISRQLKYFIKAPFKTSDKFNWQSKIFRLNDTLLAINGKTKGFYLIHYNQKSDTYTLDPKVYFENYFCSSIFIDNDKRTWIGTNKGLFREKRLTGAIEKISVPNQWNPYNSDLDIRAITFSNNKIFAATATEGILVFDLTTQKVLRKLDLSKYWKLDNEVYCMASLDKDTVIAGIEYSLIWINSKNLTQGKIDLPNPDSKKIAVNILFRDSRDNMYAGITYIGRFYYRDAKEKKFRLSDYSQSDFSRIQVPMNINEDPEGNIWFVAAGACRYNYNQHQFDKFIDSINVLAITFDKSGKMYLGTRENGLLIYDVVTKEFQHFTRSDGLPDNTILALYLHNNKLWIGTESGLACYYSDTKKIAAFGIADGMPADAFTAATFYYDSSHQQLYGAFNNAIVRFDPDKLLKNNSPPDFFIENISVSGYKTIYHPVEKIDLTYKHNDLIINLASVNFEDAYQQQFAYRFVENGNEPWEETGTQRSIIFSNLSSGKHRLQIKVYIRNNSWPEQVKEITINIQPPFWKTTWFIILFSFTIITALYFLYRSRIKTIRQKANIDKQLAEFEIKGLHAQMNPHFIFNSLNSIKEMILEDEKQNASRYLSKFAQLIRTNLDQSRQTFITVKQCIDHLQQYLEMEKIRFEQFNYTIDVEDDLPGDIRMSPMLIQPLAENAIWHGLRNKTGEKELNIRFYKSKSQLVCEIEDNGIGIHQSMKDKTGLQPTHRSLGIASINERLKILNEKYNMNSLLEIIDRSELPGKNNSGTLAILRFNF